MKQENNRELLVSVVTHYGRVAISPENDLARAFCALLKQKTLTEADVARIKDLGFEVKQKEVSL